MFCGTFRDASCRGITLPLAAVGSFLFPHRLMETLCEL
nr:MAG TPA: hypothetical protein [Caudoviricetes sp.]